MTKALKRYIKERDAMLRKCSVEELRKFVNDHKGSYTKDYINAFNEAPDAVIEVTLHKMIVNVLTLPGELRSASAVWLITHGYDLNTY